MTDTRSTRAPGGGWTRRAMAIATWVLVAVGVGMMLTPPYQAPFWGAPGSTGVWAIAFVVVGHLVLRHRPHSLVGRRLLLAALLAAATFVSNEVFAETWTSATSRGVVGTTGTWLWAPGVVAMAAAVLRFPDGMLPSRRWRLLEPGLWFATCVMGIATLLGPVTPAVAATADNPFAIDRLAGVLQPLGAQGTAVYVLLQVGLALCIAAPFVRHRGAQGAEREQLHLFGTAVLILSVTILAFEMASTLWFHEVVVVTWVTSLAVALIPVAMGVAILRHRMFDADRLFSRTVTYVALTLLLAGLYAASVVVLQVMLRPAGSGSDLAVAASTLGVAALFGPLRRRVQALVDRRFNRAWFDATRTIAGFGQRLRDEVDLEAVRDDLGRTVAATVEPTTVSLWLPDPGA